MTDAKATIGDEYEIDEQAGIKATVTDTHYDDDSHDVIGEVKTDHPTGNQLVVEVDGDTHYVPQSTLVPWPDLNDLIRVVETAQELVEDNPDASNEELIDEAMFRAGVCLTETQEREAMWALEARLSKDCIERWEDEWEATGSL